LSLVDKQGLNQYQIVKRISQEQNLATSTIKSVLAKLKRANLIISNGSVELTDLGRFVVGIFVSRTR